MCNSVNSYIQEQTRLMHIAHRKKRLHMETPNGRLKAVVKKKIEEKRCTREIIHKKNYQCTLCKVRQLNPLRITSSCGIYSVLNKRTVLNSHYTICSKAASPFFFNLYLSHVTSFKMEITVSLQLNTDLNLRFQIKKNLRL